MSDESARPGCPVCGSTSTRGFLRRPSVPVHQNLLLDDASSARGIARGCLDLRICEQCTFAFNSDFRPGLLDYGRHYDNTQTWSDVFSAYVDDMVRDLIEVDNVHGCRVVEVGCGKGTFLKRLIAHEAGENVGFGFDPSYVGSETALEGRVHFYPRFYDEEAAEVLADVVICRHVIEHVPDPLKLLRSVKRALVRSEDARVFFETPCLEWILRNQVSWDLFYEHCSLFTSDSLARAFERVGMEVVSVRHVFDGQYLWLEALAHGESHLDLVPESGASPGRRERGRSATDLVDLACEFARTEHRQIDAWRAQLQRHGALGAVALWGAGAKGVTFCNLADPDLRSISCVVDVNPAKQGKYIAGTGHRIVGPEGLQAKGVAVVLVLNPNYVDEIGACVNEMGSRAVVIDLMRA